MRERDVTALTGPGLDYACRDLAARTLHPAPQRGGTGRTVRSGPRHRAPGHALPRDPGKVVSVTARQLHHFAATQLILPSSVQGASGKLSVCGLPAGVAVGSPLEDL